MKAQQQKQTTVIAPLANVGLISAIEKIRQRPLITLFLSDEVLINDDCVYPLYQQLSQLGKQPALDIFLYSRGGTTETPWKVVSLLREFSSHISVIVPYRAHSAATHIALGANEILMGPLSEISPVDPTRMHPLLPHDAQGEPIPISVQDLHHCLRFVRREITNKDKQEKLLDLYEKMFDYVNPLALGAIEQSYQLSRLITRKVLETHMDKVRDEEKIQKITDYLSGHYQSHAYTIGRKEAAEELGLPIVYPDALLAQKIWDLYLYYRDEVLTTIADDHDRIGYRHIAFVDSVRQRNILQHRMGLEQQINDMMWIETSLT